MDWYPECNDTNPLSGLVRQLTILPGVGAKSAQRLAFFLLSLSEKEVTDFATEIVKTRREIRYCSACFNISVEEKCHICLDSDRDPSVLAVVANPQDIFSLEKMGQFKGFYHVLGGLISPLDGMFPDLLRMKELAERIRTGLFKEVVLAINPSVEGDATCLYIQSLLEPFDVSLTKLAHGLPMGADIDYTDELTLQRALEGRVLV